MARPTKQGIDYFPLDTHFDDDTQLFIAEVGAEGLGIIITLLQIIYSNNGYYIDYDIKLPLKVKQKCYSETEIIVNVINKAVNAGIFDKKLFKKYNILTSRGIQKRYFSAASRKKVVEYCPDFMLIEVNDYNNLVNVSNNSKIVNRNATKEKEKEKEKVKVKVNNMSSKNTRLAEFTKKVIDYLNQKINTKYKYTTKTTQRLVSARMADGFTLDDFKKVIDNKVFEWGSDMRMTPYLRPQTLFGTKFESYLNQVKPIRQKTKNDVILEEGLKDWLKEE